jgi:spore maturation protein CgeB
VRDLLAAVVRDGDLARHLAEHGRATILARHTCCHRVDELLAIARELKVDTGVRTAAPAETAR